MYGVGGERRLTEIELDLDGYRGSRPVRIGNAASTQQQFDVYGELLDLAWRWHERGHSPDDDYWRFLVEPRRPGRRDLEAAGSGHVGDARQASALRAVEGDVLGRARQGSAAGARIASAARRPAAGVAARNELRATIERRGYSKRTGTFVQAFGSTELDASLLLLPAYDFVAWDDERMVRTVDAIGEHLVRDGMVLRYATDDGVAGGEAPFVACTFWYAECLAHQGRLDDAPRRRSIGPRRRPTISACTPRSSIRRPASCSATSRRG